MNCSPLTHLPHSRIRIRYRDDDGDMVNLIDDRFSFTELIRSGREVKDRDYKKIFIQASEVDSPMYKTGVREGLETPASSSRAAEMSFQPRYLTFSSPAPAATSSSQGTKSPLDAQKQELEENLQLLRVQIGSANEELAKLNNEQKQYQSLNQIRGRLCNNCHSPGHTKTTCSNSPCSEITRCKIKEKHPECRNKITQLQKEIKSLESKFIEEEAHYKSFSAARERAKTSFF